MASYIELSPSNLYSTGFLTTETDGTEVLERIPLKIKPEWQDKWYIVQAEDELDLLAEQFYGTITQDASKYWWVLAEANGIPNPLSIENMTGVYMLVPEFFRIKRLVQDIQNGDIPFLDDTETYNYFEILDNPPTPINPPNDPTDPVGGNTDVVNNIEHYAIFKRPYGSGYVLLTADADGIIQGTKGIDPADYPNSIIFEPNPTDV